MCGRKYHKPTWDCGDLYVPKEALDHLFPRRFLYDRGLEPHNILNIASVCNRCHGLKLVIETRLFAGDTHSFMRGLIAMDYCLDRVKEAAEFYGLDEVKRWLL